MAIAFTVGEVQTGGVNGNTTSAIDTTGSTLLVIASAYYNASPVPTVSDSKSNTWTPLTVRSGDFTSVRLYYCTNPTVGSGHTFTMSQSGSYGSIAVAAFSGTLDAAPTGENGAGTASGTSLATGSLTPSEDNCVLVTGLAYYSVTFTGAATINSSFTVTNSQADASCIGAGIAYKVQTSAGAENPTWTPPAGAGSIRMAAGIAAFKAAGGGGGFIAKPNMRQIQAINRASRW